MFSFIIGSKADSLSWDIEHVRKSEATTHSFMLCFQEARLNFFVSDVEQ